MTEQPGTNVTAPKKLIADEILKKSFEHLMGQVIDMARISPMGDRNFDQYAKSVRKHTYEILERTMETLKQFGCLAEEVSEEKKLG